MCPHCILGTVKTVLLSAATVAALYTWAGFKVVKVLIEWRERKR
jgi:hypothetical protein